MVNQQQSLNKIILLLVCFTGLLMGDVIADLPSPATKTLPYVAPAYAQYEVDPDQMIQQFNQAIRVNAKDFRADYNRGLAYMAKGNFDQAILDFDKTIELNAQFTDAYFYRAAAYYFKAKEREDFKSYNMYFLENDILQESVKEGPSKIYILRAKEDLNHAGRLGYQQPLAKKPVIYLYPSKKERVTVSLEYQGKITVSYPKYNENLKGWDVMAYPDGHIVDSTNKEYAYLFWEGIPSETVPYDFSEGFIVKGEDSAEFLQDILQKFGLTPKEYNEFIVYWYPWMKNNKYNLVHFAGQEYESSAKLSITPKPDSILRIFMVFKSVDRPMAIKSPKIVPFVRKGFTVVEWGGSELK
jgi:tetratricopeptide (TPR) repeat protein